MAGKILRTKKENNFVQIDKRILNDKELSWQAKGLHTYLMSLPDNWVVNVSDLKNRSTNGRDSTGAIINELIAAGYVTRQLLQSESGKFEGYDYTIFEEKQAVAALSVSGETVNGKSVNGLSVYGKPDTNKNININITSTNIDIKQEAESEKNAFFGGAGKENSKTSFVEQKKEKLPPNSARPPKKKESKNWADVLNELTPDVRVFIDCTDGRVAWFEWLTYLKDEHRKTWKTAKGEARSIKHLFKLSNGSHQKARDLIEYASSQRWQGLYPIKEQPQSAQLKRPLIYDPKNNEQHRNEKPAF